MSSDLQSELERERNAKQVAQDLADHYRMLHGGKCEELKTTQRRLDNERGTMQSMLHELRDVLPAGFRGDNPVWACEKIADYIADLRGQVESATGRALAAEAERDNARRDAGDLWSVAAECMKILGQDAEAWRQAAKRLERQRDKQSAVNFELNAQVLRDVTARTILTFCQKMLADETALSKELVAIAKAHHRNHQAALATARRLAAAWRSERARSQALADAVRGLLDEPYGCPLCDAGRMLNPEKGHWPDCPYETARALVGKGEV